MDRSTTATAVSLWRARAMFQFIASSGPAIAPRTRHGLALRDLRYRLLTTRALTGLFGRIVKDAATDSSLPEYV